LITNVPPLVTMSSPAASISEPKAIIRPSGDQTGGSQPTLSAARARPSRAGRRARLGPRPT
jgi:hypothetical protein